MRTPRRFLRSRRRGSPARSRSPLRTPQTRSPVVSSPSSVSSVGSWVPSPLSSHRFESLPSGATHRGKTLSNYRSFTIDICNLAVTLHPPGSRAPPDSYLIDFCKLLSLERIEHSRLHASNPLYASTVLFRTADDLHTFACRSPSRIRMISAD